MDAAGRRGNRSTWPGGGKLISGYDMAKVTAIMYSRNVIGSLYGARTTVDNTYVAPFTLPMPLIYGEAMPSLVANAVSSTDHVATVTLISFPHFDPTELHIL